MFAELTMPVIIIFLITGLLTAWIAKQKGYDPVVGFVAGFFASLAGALVFLALRKKGTR